MSPRRLTARQIRQAALTALAESTTTGLLTHDVPGRRVLVLIAEGDMSEPATCAVGVAHNLKREEARTLLDAARDGIVAGEGED